MDEQCKFCGLLQQPFASMHMAGCPSSGHFKETVGYDTPIEGEDEINFRNPFNTSSVKRRQFDVSKLKEPIRPPNGYVEDEYNYAWEKSKWDTQKQVLEAWNEGRIEELLEGWTK